jgi:hypothetical protein
LSGEVRPKVPVHLFGKKRDLTLEVSFVIEIAIFLDATPGKATDLIHFRNRMFSRRLAVMAPIVVPL